MKPRAMDTDEWVERKQFELIKEASPDKRLRLALQLSAFSWNAARFAIDRLHPNESQEQRDHRFMTQIYGKEIADQYRDGKKAYLNAQGEKA